MNVTKENLWDCLENSLREKNCAIEGDFEDLKEELFQDYKIALKHFGDLSAKDFIEKFLDEMFNHPLQMCDSVITPKGVE